MTFEDKEWIDYLIEPQLGGLQWIKGKVHNPDGDVSVYCSTSQIKVTGAGGTGTLRFKSKAKPVCKQGAARAMGNGAYELTVEKGRSYAVSYRQ